MPECDICGREDFKTRKGVADHKALKHPNGPDIDIQVPAEEAPEEEYQPNVDVDGLELVGDAVPWNPEAARRRQQREAAEQAEREEREREREELAAERAKQANKVTFAETPVHIVASAPEPAYTPPNPTQAPLRRQLDQVRYRCRDGFPESMDAKWLLARVEDADELLATVALPHVYARWVESLTE
jgi:hypothetical protein